MKYIYPSDERHCEEQFAGRDAEKELARANDKDLQLAAETQNHKDHAHCATRTDQ